MEFEVEKRKKVTRGLMVCGDDNYKCIDCPYHPSRTGNPDCSNHLCKDALTLLKEQENGVEPKTSKEEDGYTWYYCGKCGYEIDPSYENYCPTCGTKIKLKEDRDA